MLKREVFSLPIRDIASCQGFDKEIFITPEDGQAILAQIMTVIADIPSNIKFFFELDFLGVYYCSNFFAEELVIKLQRHIREETDFMIFLTNTTDLVKRSLCNTIVLYRKQTGINVPLLYLENEEFKILGEVEDNLEETFQFVKQKEMFTARELKDIKKLSKNSASNRLRKLYDFRLVDRLEQEERHGSPQLYFLPRI